jgi:O-acetylhomoserine (thiol)-lyase
MNSILTICNAGEHFLSMQDIYGGTYTLFTATLKKMGIEVSFVNQRAPDAEIAAAIRPNTKLIYGETIGNPGLDILDIERIAKVAHANGLPLILDNTFPTPYLCRPFEFGADIVIHSTTKYLDGHATSVGGVIVDSGKFNWEKSGRHPHLTDPDPNYHGLSYTKKYGKAAYAAKARVVFIRDIGNIMAPFNAFLTNLGCETLALRMERHSQNALKIAEFLEKHPNVSWINYPGLKTSPSYELCKKYLPLGASGVITFGVKGGVETGKKFINSLKLVSLLVHVGDVRTMVLHPASMTHRQLNPEQQLSAGVKPDMIRLSVGIENVNEIIEDLDQALRK